MIAGRSPDGTAECLDKLAACDPRVIVKHQPDWDGIISMNNACLPDYPCLLMQMSIDEVWPVEAVDSAIRLFEAHPEKTAASVYCKLWMGQEIMVEERHWFGNECEENFRVLWRYEPGMTIVSYEPPLLSGNHTYFSRQEMWDNGVFFNHFQFVGEKQAKQKEEYYSQSNFGLAKMHVGIVDRWKALQTRENFPSPINDVFPWAPQPTMAVKVPRHPFFNKF